MRGKLPWEGQPGEKFFAYFLALLKVCREHGLRENVLLLSTAFFKSNFSKQEMQVANPEILERTPLTRQRIVTEQRGRGRKAAGLDYIIRDASTMGYQSVSIDYERLLSGIVAVRGGEYNFTVGFRSLADFRTGPLRRPVRQDDLHGPADCLPLSGNRFTSCRMFPLH